MVVCTGVVLKQDELYHTAVLPKNSAPVLCVVVLVLTGASFGLRGGVYTVMGSVVDAELWFLLCSVDIAIMLCAH